MNVLVNWCVDVFIVLGIVKGDCVVLLMFNSVEFCCLFYGVVKFGVVVVFINICFVVFEVSFILFDSGSKVVIYGVLLVLVIDVIRVQVDFLGMVIDWIGVDLLVECLRLVVVDELVVECGGDDNLFIMYILGIIGYFKGVVYIYELVYLVVSFWVLMIDVCYCDCLLLLLLMFYVVVLMMVIFSVMCGVMLILMLQFDVMKVWLLIVEEWVCIGGVVLVIFNFMCQVFEFVEFDVFDFCYFIIGGVFMLEVLIKIYVVKNIEVVQGYVFIEFCGGGILLFSEDVLCKVGLVGCVIMFIDVVVCGDDGVICEYGEGEVVIKFDILFKEYWNCLEVICDVFDNGWFWIGDIGEIDDEGYFYIKDWLKDMIIFGGENVYLVEIESVIIGVFGVSEVVVIGLFDEKWGEIVVVIVVVDQNEVSEQQIVEYCGIRFVCYKLFKKVIFVEVIFCNLIGKIFKMVLCEQYLVMVLK